MTPHHILRHIGWIVTNRGRARPRMLVSGLIDSAPIPRPRRAQTQAELDAIAKFIAERGVTVCMPGDVGSASDICAYCGKRVPIKDFRIWPATGNRSSVCNWCHSSVWSRAYAKRRGPQDAKRIPSLEIYERDEWVCQLCGGRIDPDLAGPHSMSKTTDHIMPLSKGGLHEIGNLQSAHLGCNISKGNRYAGASPAARRKRQKTLGELLIG